MRRKRKQKIKSESENSVKVLKDEKSKKKKVRQSRQSKKKAVETPDNSSGEYTLYCYSGQRFRFYLTLKTQADTSKLPKVIRKFINSKKDELDLKYSNKITKVVVKEIDLKVRI